MSKTKKIIAISLAAIFLFIGSIAYLFHARYLVYIPDELGEDYKVFLKILDAYKKNNHTILSVEEKTQLHQSIKNFENYPTTYHEPLGLGYFLCSNFLIQEKQFDEALQAVQMAEQQILQVSTQHHAIGDIYNLKAMIHEHQGDVDLASAHLKLAIEHFDHQEAFNRQAVAYINFAKHETVRRNPDLALNYIEKADYFLKKAPKAPSDISVLTRKKLLSSNIYLQKSWNWSNMGEVSKSKQVAKIALDKLQTAFEEKEVLLEQKAFYQLGKVYLDQGTLQLELGQFTAARYALQEAICYFDEKEEVENQSGKGLAKVLLGQAYAELGDFEAAFSEVLEGVALLNLSLDDFWQSNLPRLYDVPQLTYLLTALDTRATIAWAYYKQASNLSTQRLKQVHALQKSNIALLDSIRLGMALNESVIGVSSRFKNVYYDAAQTVYELHQQTNSTKYLNELFQLMEQSRSFALKMDLNQKRQRQVHKVGVQFELIEQYYNLRQKIYNLSAQLTQAKKQEHPTITLQKDLLQAKQTLQTFVEKCKDSNQPELQKFYQTYFNLEAPSLSAVQKRFCPDEHTAVFSYLLGEKPLLMVITAQKVQVLELPLEEGWTYYLEQYLQYIQQDIKGAEMEYLKVSHRLYQQLVQPGIELLEQDKMDLQHLRLMPDGVLRKMSFAALITEEPENASLRHQKYLGTSYALRYNYFLDEKIAKKTTPTTKKGACFAAQYRTIAKADWTTVTASSEERRHYLPLSAMHNTAQRLVQEQPDFWDFYDNAPKDSLLNKDIVYEMAYLVMHGQSQGSNPLEYALAFQQVGMDSVSYLSIADIYQHNIKTNLLVLGSCETATGWHAQSEGIISIARAFYLSGCSTIVGTMGVVNDFSTAHIHYELMTAVLADTPVDVALQNAQLSYLKNANEGMLSPYFWANVNVIGE